MLTFSGDISPKPVSGQLPVGRRYVQYGRTRHALKNRSGTVLGSDPVSEGHKLDYLGVDAPKRFWRRIIGPRSRSRSLTGIRLVSIAVDEGCAA